MTEVDFHFNATDKVNHTCRLVRKAIGTGAKVVVMADDALLTRLDLALWQFSATEFIVHCRDDALPEMLLRSPVILTTSGRSTLPHQHVLINLGAEIPQGFERFERLIEIVTEGDDDRQAGRMRWRHYADRGYTLKRHDLRAEVA